MPIRWFVGLQINSTFDQIDNIEAVVADFNASQDEINLILEVAAIDGAYDMFATQVSAGVGPDIVGPINWGTAVGFPDQWLVLDRYITAAGFDTAVYHPSLLQLYQTDDGQISLPFAAYPSAIYYIPALFDEVGLAYPPQFYGDKYLLNGRLVDWNWETVTEIARLLTLDADGYNANQPEFDRTNIVQVGFHPQAQSVTSLAAFFGAARIYAGEEQGSYVSTIPPNWRAAWQWWYDGMWGQRPFMAADSLANSYEFGSGSPFNAGRVAMALGQLSYTCCLGDLQESGLDFQVGVLPMDADGVVNGRVSELSFYIWQGTAHPREAFQALSYILTTGSHKLLPAYDAMPALVEQTDAFIAQKIVAYPAVTAASWQVFVQSLAYYDRPSADQYLPNRNEAANRLQIFGDSLVSAEDLDFDAEFQQLQEDLTLIYNR